MPSPKECSFQPPRWAAPTWMFCGWPGVEAIESMSLLENKLPSGHRAAPQAEARHRSVRPRQLLGQRAKAPIRGGAYGARPLAQHLGR